MAHLRRVTARAVTALPRKALIITGVSAALLAGVLAPLASAAPSIAGPDTVYHGCVKTSGSLPRVLFDVYSTKTPACPKGSFSIHWNQTGPAGPAGPPGPATLNVSAVTALKSRPDSGNGGTWATDTVTRTAAVTRHSGAPSSDCGPTAARCWFYTATITDTGTFTTIAGAETPNQACTEPSGTSCNGLLISGKVTGNITGGGTQEFYADSFAPSASGVPTTATGDPGNPASCAAGDSNCTTTLWYEQFFPAGTNFGTTPNSNAPWTAWSWTYSAPSTCEMWTDAYNNGDGNGSYGQDGNIAGQNQCSG